MMRQGREAGVPVGHSEWPDNQFHEAIAGVRDHDRTISDYFQKPEVPFPKIVRRLMRWLLLDNPLKALIFDRLRTLD
jgi:hypothetical protein